MKQSVIRGVETLLLASVALIHLGGRAWAVGGPPPPPNVPVGGVGSAVATAILIVGYGIWKSRR